MGFLSLLLLIFLAFVVVSSGLRFLEDRRRVEGGGPSADQLERIESALTALESRVDELQDQQHFLERLLAERPERPRLSGQPPADEATDSVLFDTRPEEPEEER